MKQHNTGQERKHKCDICDMAYFTSSDLRQHMIKHTDERRFKCNQCGKAYRYYQHLDRHVKTVHLNKYKFRCTKCGHGVEKMSYLRAHICGRTRRKRTVNDRPPPLMDITPIGASGAPPFEGNSEGVFSIKTENVADDDSNSAIMHLQAVPSDSVIEDVTDTPIIAEEVIAETIEDADSAMAYLYILDSNTGDTEPIELVHSDNGVSSE